MHKSSYLLPYFNWTYILTNFLLRITVLHILFLVVKICMKGLYFELLNYTETPIKQFYTL